MACKHTWQLRGTIVNGVETTSIVCVLCGEVGTSVDVNQELEQTATECLDEELRTRYSRLLVVACKALGTVEASAPNAGIRNELDRVTADGCDFLATWRKL